MKQNEFLEKIQKITNDMTKIQLQKSILELCHILKEQEYEKVIHQLKHIPLENESISLDFNEEYERITKALMAIHHREKYLIQDDEEDDDHTYEDINLFFDPDELIEDFKDGLNLLLMYIEHKNYQEGYQLLELLLNTNILVIDDDGEEVNILDGIFTLIFYNLIEIDYLSFHVNILYLTYVASDPKYRIENLYKMIKKMHGRLIEIDEILDVGDDIKDFQVFIPKWIDYLLLQNNPNDDTLITSALRLLNDEEAYLQYARTYANTHPHLYDRVIREYIDQKDWEQVLKIGNEALAYIPISNAFRSNIALKCADAAYQINEMSSIEKYWLEAFRSTPNMIHYLRMRLLGKHYDQYQSEIASIYQQNKIDVKEYYLIHFFEQDIHTTIKEWMDIYLQEDDEHMYIKEITLLFLLLFYARKNNNEITYQLVDTLLKNDSLSFNELWIGTHYDDNQDLHSLFYDFFIGWQKDIKIEKEYQDALLLRIQMYISRYIQRMMHLKKRQAYAHCALLIVTYAHLCESLYHSDPYDIIDAYKKRYKGRRVFVETLIELSERF